MFKGLKFMCLGVCPRSVGALINKEYTTLDSNIIPDNNLIFTSNDHCFPGQKGILSTWYVKRHYV